MRDAVLSLAGRLVDTGAVAIPDRLERMLSHDRFREVIQIGERVLLPHMRTDAVERMAVAVGVTHTALPTSPQAEEPTARVVVLVLAPPAAADFYLQMVAALARALRQKEVLEQMIAARSAEDILNIPELRELTIQPRLTVRDVMTQRVYRVYPDTPVRELLELMHRHRLKGVPVVGEKREVLGMVTDRDLLRHLLPTVVRTGAGERQGGEAEAAREPVRDTSVREVMSRSVMCISEDQPLAEIASLMVNKDVERFPVVTEGKLVGFLTRGDILRKLFGQSPVL